jgi:hypothetical protein
MTGCRDGGQVFPMTARGGGGMIVAKSGIDGPLVPGWYRRPPVLDDGYRAAMRHQYAP